MFYLKIIYLDFIIGNRQPSERALCELHRCNFVPRPYTKKGSFQRWLAYSRTDTNRKPYGKAALSNSAIRLSVCPMTLAKRDVFRG